MPAELTTEVCVVGGGPAGATLARRLAQLGHRVCLITQPPAARHHRFESLAPNIQPLLDLLDLREQIERAGFRRTSGFYLDWPTTTQYRRWPNGAGYLVNRPAFDQIVLDKAHEAGVRVIAARARRPFRDGGHWRVPIALDRSHPPIAAVFLAVATGKNTILPSCALPCSERTLALAAEFKGVRAGDDESRVEARVAEWVWGTWWKNGTADVIAFLDPERVRSGGVEAVRELYRRIIAGSPFWAGVTSGATQSMVRACSAASVACATPITANMIRVGEASFTVDPLSSQGVHAAMLSAIQGAIAVHTILVDRASADIAIQFYTDRQREAVAHHQTWAADCYAEVGAQERTGDFWKKRSRSQASLAAKDVAGRPRQGFSRVTRITLASGVRVLPTPAIVHDRVTLIDGIHSPRLSRPVVFLEGVPLAPLLSRLDRDQTVDDIVREWTGAFSTATALAILDWLSDRGLIECSDRGSVSADTRLMARELPGQPAEQ